jgi:hypothetical protein
VKAKTQGLRRPPASAIAPSTGLITAIAMPLAVIAQPHHAVPSTASGAMPWLK